MKTRDELLSLIARQEAQLASLDHERDEARAWLKALRHELAAIPHVPCEVSLRLTETAAQVPSSATEKVRLFRSLFRGRSEVFPTRFLSKKSGILG